MPNDSLIHADIFFFISTIALVILSIGFGVVIFYAIKILKDGSEIVQKIKIESGEIVADSKKFRQALRDEGVKWGHIIHLVRGFFMRDSVKDSDKKSVRKVKPKSEIIN